MHISNQHHNQNQEQRTDGKKKLQIVQRITFLLYFYLLFLSITFFSLRYLRKHKRLLNIKVPSLIKIQIIQCAAQSEYLWSLKSFLLLSVTVVNVSSPASALHHGHSLPLRNLDSKGNLKLNSYLEIVSVCLIVCTCVYTCTCLHIFK